MVIRSRAPSTCTVQAGLSGTAVQVVLRGEFDCTTVAVLEGMLALVAGKSPRDVVLHMGEVAFLDGACARVIAQAARALPGPGRLAIHSPSPVVRRVFQLTGLDAAVPLDAPGPAPPPAPPAGPGQHAGLTLTALATAIGVPQGTLRRAAELGLLPPPDIPAGRWSPPVARDIQDRWPQTAPAVAAAEDLGAVRCAELLSRLTGLTVHPAHIEDLATRGLLQPSRTYRHRPLYRIADLHTLAAGPLTRALLTEIAGTDG